METTEEKEESLVDLLLTGVIGSLIVINFLGLLDGLFDAGAGWSHDKCVRIEYIVPTYHLGRWLASPIKEG